MLTPEEVQETGVVQPALPPVMEQEGDAEKEAVEATQEFDVCVHTPLKQEKLQEPPYPVAQLPAELPEGVAGSEQLLVVFAGHEDTGFTVTVVDCAAAGDVAPEHVSV